MVSSTSVGAGHEEDLNMKTPDWMKATAPMATPVAQACDSDEGAHLKFDEDHLQPASPAWVYEMTEETPPKATPPAMFNSVRQDEAGRRWLQEGGASHDAPNLSAARAAWNGIEVVELQSPSWMYDKREETLEGTHLWMPMLANSWNSPSGVDKKSPLDIQTATATSKRIDFDRDDIRAEEVEAEIQTLVTAVAQSEQEEGEESVTEFGR
jgi:hypothetical protein